MRVYIRTTANTSIVPYGYQPKLVGALHKWLGDNHLHDELSIYSLSWLSRGKGNKMGLNFPKGATFFFSTPNVEIIKDLIGGLQSSPKIAFGFKVLDVMIKPTPEFSDLARFNVQSPVVIKRSVEGGHKYFFAKDLESDNLMTETLKHKLEKAGKGHLKATVSFDRTYGNIREKLTQFKKIGHKGTICPAFVKGDPEAVSFAWDVGIGNLTGIGFGALQ